MSPQGASEGVPAAPAAPAEPLRTAFLGPAPWLENCAPADPAANLAPACFPAGGDGDAQLAAINALRPDVSVVFDPPALEAGLLAALPGVTLGVLVEAPAAQEESSSLRCLDRLVCFDPALGATQIGGCEVWRAIPPPVSDLLFAGVRPLHHAPRAISIGRSTEHREAMLMPVKHHHDLFQVVHGVSGELLRGLLAEFDVGVFVAREEHGAFEVQAGIHLAAGQLLLSEELAPAHGLERGIDYLLIRDPEETLWLLDRLRRFPEMYQRVRVRGHMKAAQYRASRLFSRLAHDLLRDVGAFGRGAAGRHGEAHAHTEQPWHA